MTADIKMLPLTLRHPSDKDLADHVQTYARAVAEHNVAARDAEIETLRAALESLKAHQGNATMNQTGIIKALEEVRDEQGAEIHRLRAAKGQAEARAERLAEALDTIARVGKASRNQTTRTRWIVARAVSALNGDNDWRQITKPKGYHDALERAALRDHDQEGK